MTKTQQCADCAHFEYNTLGAEALCAEGHKLRFFLPKGPTDSNYGWKRRCADFVQSVSVIDMARRKGEK